jgi:hypothetical protein
MNPYILTAFIVLVNATLICSIFFGVIIGVILLGILCIQKHQIKEQMVGYRQAMLAQLRIRGHEKGIRTGIRNRDRIMRN